MSANGHVVVITGAAEGIGWATAQCFAAQGWRVALLDLHGDAAQQRASSLGDVHTAWACDVTNEEQVKAVIAQVQQTYGQINAVVNNAGIGDQTVPTLNQSIDAFDRVLSVHLRGCFLVSREAISHMQKQARDAAANRGAIVNVGSIASTGGIPGRNAYCAAKAGVLGMTRALASEWARHGIRVNAVTPGYVRTALVESLAHQGAINATDIANRTPMGRMASPAEIANVIEFLASSRASFVTGAVVAADGGWTAFGAPESALPAIEEVML